jgi:hypothetical protein
MMMGGWEIWGIPSDDSSGVLDVRSLSGVLDAKICICNPLHHDIPASTLLDKSLNMFDLHLDNHAP